MKRLLILFLCLLTLPTVAKAVTTVYPDGTILENIKEIRFDTTYTNNCNEGVAYWNQDDATLNIGITGNVCLQVGQEQLIRVTNKSGSDFTDGQSVYIDGAQGNRPTIALANAVTEATSSKTVGVLTEDIANNSSGYVTTFGLVRDIDTSGFSEGDTLWLSTTPGGIQNTVPPTPNHATFIGFCVTSHATEGVMLVNIQNGFEIYELHDVLITSATDGDNLVYNGTYWENLPTSYGQLYYHSHVATLDVATTTAFVNVFGFTNSLTMATVLDGTNGFINTSQDGVYDGNVSMSFTSAGVETYHFYIGVNGTEKDECAVSRKLSTPADIGAASINCIVELSAGDQISLMVNSLANDTVQFESVNLHIELDR